MYVCALCVWPEMCIYVLDYFCVCVCISGGLLACQKLQLLMADGNLVINSAVSEYCVEKYHV